jgi:hypothetical protein
VFFASLNLQIKFPRQSDLTMSPRTPNAGVVDFGVEEIREQPRDTSKRQFFGVPAQCASRKLMHKIGVRDN